MDRESHKENLLKFFEMAESKKAKVDKRDGLLSRIIEYQADQDFAIEQIVRVTSKEELLKPDKREETVAECEIELEDQKAFLRPKKAVVDNLYTGAPEHEKGFFQTLSRKNPAVAECISTEGVHIARRPEEYNITPDQLAQMRIDMEARIKAIDYEILRREKEPRMEALKFIISHFKEEEADLARPQTQPYDE